MAGDSRRLLELSMVPRLAQEVANQINTPKAGVVAITAITTPDATDLATVLTLANATKAKVNALIAALNS